MSFSRSGSLYFVSSILLVFDLRLQEAGIYKGCHWDWDYYIGVVFYLSREIKRLINTTFTTFRIPRNWSPTCRKSAFNSHQSSSVSTNSDSGCGCFPPVKSAHDITGRDRLPRDPPLFGRNAQLPMHSSTHPPSWSSFSISPSFSQCACNGCLCNRRLLDALLPDFHSLVSVVPAAPYPPWSPIGYVSGANETPT